jgi:exonuclease VII small subunit
LLRSRLDNNISEAAYTGKAKDYADEFARISSAVRQLERDHPALHNVIDRLQREEKEHWTIVLELQRVELALVKHVQKEAEEEELEATEHHHHHHHQHHHHEKEQSKKQ